jgi:hypothetical protein
MPKSLGARLLASMPGDVVRSLFTERATSDIAISADYVLNVASRYRVEYGLSYLDCIKQLVPMWLLRPQSLTDRQRDLVAHGIMFAGDFMGQEIALQLPTRERVEGIHPEALSVMHGFLVDVMRLRRNAGACWEAFCEPAKQLTGSLGDRKGEIVSSLRAILGQKQGVPASRLLFLLSMEYLQALEYMLDLRLGLYSESLPVIETIAA